MQLHHQAIVKANAGHLHQHMTPEARCIVRCGLAFQGALEYGLGFRARQFAGIGRHGRMIGRPGAHLFEKGPPLLQGNHKRTRSPFRAHHPCW